MKKLERLNDYGVALLTPTRFDNLLYFHHFSPELWSIDLFLRAYEHPYVHKSLNFFDFEKKVNLEYVQWKFFASVSKYVSYILKIENFF